MNGDIVIYSAVVFLVAFLGGMITLIKSWSDEWLHLFLSFGAGIFLGVVFLHLMPEAIAYGHSVMVPTMVLVGYLLLFFLEKFLFSHGPGDTVHSHKVISITAMAGLSVHSLIEGLGLAVGSTDVRLGAVILLSILAHKATAAFSLTSLFVLGEFPKKKSILLLLLFSLMTPLGALVMTPFFAYGSKIVVEVLTGLTAGTFLWVATGDMLPEVFHTQDKRWVKLALLLAGIAVMFLLSLVGGSHAH